MAEVALTADVRTDLGSSNSRRLRSSGRIPGVVYGHGTDPKAVSVAGRELRLALNTDAGVNVLISLEIEGKKHLALARDLQRHPVKNTVTHVDFQVVNRNEQISADVPITFIGEALKVTKQGGVVETLINSLGITATPDTMPAHLEVDISELELESAIRVKDIKLPKGVLATIDGEEPVVVGKATRTTTTEGEEGEASAAEGAATPEA